MYNYTTITSPFPSASQIKPNPSTQMGNDMQSPNNVNDERKKVGNENIRIDSKHKMKTRKDEVLVGDDMDLSLASSVLLSPESILRNVLDKQEAQADKKIADGLNRYVFGSKKIHLCIFMLVTSFFDIVIHQLVSQLFLFLSTFETSLCPTFHTA